MMLTTARFFSRTAVVTLLLGFVLFSSVCVWHDRIMKVAGPHQVDVLVVIKPGSGHQTIREVLDRAGVLHQVYHYDAARLIAGNSFLPKAGEFMLPARSNLNGILSIIHKGQSYQRRLTIVEGLRSSDVVRLLNSTPSLTGEISLLPNEGSLWPDTYFYTRATQRQGLIDRMQKTQELVLAEAWGGRSKELPYEEPRDALVMASIIEKEASAGGDRRLVAAVLVNRLKKGMRLQSDPTVLYKASESSSTMASITKTDLKRETPWNTYVISGLPKTPICNPGQDSIMAALHPAESDYLYFVSDGTGGLRFAKTLDAHNHNVRLFRQHEASAKKGRDK